MAYAGSSCHVFMCAHLLSTTQYGVWAGFFFNNTVYTFRIVPLSYLNCTRQAASGGQSSLPGCLVRFDRAEEQCAEGREGQRSCLPSNALLFPCVHRWTPVCIVCACRGPAMYICIYTFSYTHILAHIHNPQCQSSTHLHLPSCPCTPTPTPHHQPSSHPHLHPHTHLHPHLHTFTLTPTPSPSHPHVHPDQPS